MTNTMTIAPQGAQVMLMVPKSEWDAQAERIERIESLILMNAKNARNEEWLSGKDVAEMLGISPRTLQNWRDQRAIRFSQVGDIIRYKKSDVDEFLDDHIIEERYG